MICLHQAFRYKTFKQIFSLKHLYKSAKICCKGHHSQLSILSFKANIWKNIKQIYKELHNDQYKFQGFYSFYTYNGDKLRCIDSLQFKDKIVYKCLCKYYLIPLLEKVFIYDNPAHQIGKGIHWSIKRVKKFLTCNNNYVVKFDLSEFFNSVNRDKLKNLIDKFFVIDDNKLHNLIFTVIDNFQYMREVNGNKGLGLGTELSQLLALFYTTPLDYFIKSKLRIKYYIRYVDDGLFFSSTYEEAYEQLNQIRKFLKDYDLYLNRDKCRIIPLTESFTFLKLQIYKSNTGKIHIQLGDKGMNN